MSNGLVSRLVDDTIDLGFMFVELMHLVMELILFYWILVVCVMVVGHLLAWHVVIMPEILHGQNLIVLMWRYMVCMWLD